MRTLSHTQPHCASELRAAAAAAASPRLVFGEFGAYNLTYIGNYALVRAPANTIAHLWTVNPHRPHAEQIPDTRDQRNSVQLSQTQTHIHPAAKKYGVRARRVRWPTLVRRGVACAHTPGQNSAYFVASEPSKTTGELYRIVVARWRIIAALHHYDHVPERSCTAVVDPRVRTMCHPCGTRAIAPAPVLCTCALP